MRQSWRGVAPTIGRAGGLVESRAAKSPLLLGISALLHFRLECDNTSEHCCCFAGRFAPRFYLFTSLSMAVGCSKCGSASVPLRWLLLSRAGH